MRNNVPIMSWLRFLVQIQKDARLWLVVLAVLGCGRLGVLLSLHGAWEPMTGIADLATACLRGMRFDAQVATGWCVVPVLLSILCGFRDWSRFGDGVRLLLAGAFAISWPLLLAVDIGFYGEYHDQFNHFLFGAVYDDQAAILRTVWTSYHPLRHLSGALVAAVLVGWVAIRLIRRPFLTEEQVARVSWTRPRRALLMVILAAMLVVTGRASLERRPLQQKDAAVTADRCLNSWVPTPAHALHYAISAHQEIQDVNGLVQLIGDGDDLPTFAAAAFPALGRRPLVEDYLRRTAPGTARPARHVFLMIMESYDAWPLLERWRPLHLTDQVAALGGQGVLITDFLPIGTGTMTSLAAILTGLPDVGVHTAFQPSVRQPLPSSPAAIFRRLGYRTRFFYSGYLSWQRIGDFCAEQGFDQVFGGGHIGNPSGNEWGVDDEDLFAYVLRSVDDDQPSFNVILSTSNHPPFAVDVDRKGFPLRAIPAWTGHDQAGGYTRTQLGHLWYGDRCAGDFIRGVERRLPETVVALTGDHWSRRFLHQRPDFQERSCVPLLLYGPSVLAGVDRTRSRSGGHLDIAPTLIELCAPAGFIYHSLGANLLCDHHTGLGLGSGRLIGPGFLVDLDPSPQVHPAGTIRSPPDLPALIRWYRACNGLGWWRLMRGSELTSPGH